MSLKAEVNQMLASFIRLCDDCEDAGMLKSVLCEMQQRLTQPLVVCRRFYSLVVLGVEGVFSSQWKGSKLALASFHSGRRSA